MTARVSGYATPEGTKQYQERYEGKGEISEGHFREVYTGHHLSSLGMGSYLGNPNPETDHELSEAATLSIASGAMNVIDTAINYRFQASERALGQAITDLVHQGKINREEVFICSKNGFLTPDYAVDQDFKQYLMENYIEPGIINPEDVVEGSHCMSPSYLDDQLDRSLRNLGLETLDLMYLHNAAESQLPAVGRPEFYQRLMSAFTFYESAREENRIRHYGMATWSCFRSRPDNEEEYMNLETVVEIARSIGGENHGFRYIQLPFNFAMLEAYRRKTQTVDGEPMTLLQAAETLGIGVFTSVPLLQGQLLGHRLPHFPGLESQAQFCLQFVRSTPGIICPLVGQKKQEHVRDNLHTASVPPLSRELFETLFSPQKA